MSSVRSFHRVLGRDVTLTSDGCGVTVTSSLRDADCCCYAFTAHALDGGDVICAQVLDVNDDVVSRGGLAFGMTSCDPDTVNPSELPDDPEMLVDRSEYWVVVKDVLRGSTCRPGDILAFTRADSGEVRLHRNGEYVKTLMHVDRTLPMWAFFDLCAGIKKLQLLTSTREPLKRNSCPEASPVNDNTMENTSMTVPIEYIRKLTEKYIRNMATYAGKETSGSRPNQRSSTVTALPERADNKQQIQQLSLAEKTTLEEFLKEAHGETAASAKSSQKESTCSAASQPALAAASVARSPTTSARPTLFKFRSSVSCQEDANRQSERVVLSPSAVRTKNRWPPPGPPSSSGVNASSSEQPNGKNSYYSSSSSSPVASSRNNPSGVIPVGNTNRHGVILRRELEPHVISGTMNTTPQQSTGMENPQFTSNSDRLKAESIEKPEISSNECCSCWEKPKDCVLYRCGHLCLCYDCATKIKQRQQPPLCPICRQPIDDIIRMYST